MIRAAAQPHTAKSASVAPRLARIFSAEVETSELIVRLDGARVDLGGNTADGHQIGAARELERQRRLLLDKHDRKTGAIELAEPFENLFDDTGRETERRFVEQEDLRLGHQRAAD